MGAPSTQWWKYSSRNPGHAEIKRINGNRHGVARPVRELLLIEVGRALVGHALRKITQVRRIVGAKNPAELIPDRKQIVVVTQIGQELLGWRIRRDVRQNRVLNSREAIVRLHHMRDPTAAGELLIEEPRYSIVGHGQRDVRRIPDRRVR